jgi:DNA-binding LytR/AlgR family response regulator
MHNLPENLGYLPELLYYERKQVEYYILKNMIRCIAIDRDAKALTELSSHLEKIPYLSLSGTFSTPFEASNILAKRGVDLLFVDPEMSPINGIDFVRSLTHNPMIVFITNSRNYAVEAFSTGVIDYIVKPVTLDRLARVAGKAYEYMCQSEKDTQTVHNKANEHSFLFMKVNNRIQRFRTSDILFIEGCSDYVKIYVVGSRPVLASMNMKTIDKLLPDGNFCRVHRSYIVSLEWIDSIERKRIKIGEHVIPVSDSYYQILMQAIGSTCC